MREYAIDRLRTVVLAKLDRPVTKCGRKCTHAMIAYLSSTAETRCGTAFAVPCRSPTDEDGGVPDLDVASWVELGRWECEDGPDWAGYARAIGASLL